MSKADLTIALERYDRHVPIFMGMVAPPPGLRLRPLEVGMSAPRRDGIDRHERFLREGEFDIAETSLSSHLIAIDRAAPFVGVPVFPRRLFSQNHIFVNASAGIEAPRDLAGKRVVIRSFQTTMSVLALGDLTFEYGMPWRDIRWLVAGGEAMPLAARQGVTAERLPRGTDISGLIVEGGADAIVFPHPPRAIFERRDRVRPLFRDRKAEAVRYYRKHGYYPIMHLIAVRRPVIDAHPELGRAIIEMWEKSKEFARAFYDDPGYAELAFARNELSDQDEVMGPDLWPTGLKANRKNLENFIRYSRDQGLISRTIEVEELFHPSTFDS